MSVVERLANGDSYYSAFGDELRHNGYPAASLFNWRTPLQMGALASAFQPEAVGISEIVAGVLVALSACAYYRQYALAGASAGIAAVFVRELAVPYGLACGLLAIVSRRKREASVWIIAGIVYGAYYVAHAWQVQAHQLPGDLAHQQSWQQWNGLRFTLATIGVNGWLQFVPRQAAALVLVFGLAGTLARAMPPQIKVALWAYVVLFAVVGLPFNSYWGFVSAPLWALAVAHAVDGLRRLITSAK